MDVMAENSRGYGGNLYAEMGLSRPGRNRDAPDVRAASRGPSSTVGHVPL